MPDEKKEPMYVDPPVAKTSEQAHWKNRDAQTWKKPAMGAFGHAMVALVLVGLGGGGLYGFGKYQDYMKGSKEMTLLEFQYYGATSPDSADHISFEVPYEEIGMDGIGSTTIQIKVPRVYVFPRSDGKNITTVKFFYRTEMSTSYDTYWTYAWILVPTEEDRVIWENELRRIKKIYDANVSSEDGKMKPRRILPDGYREPPPQKREESY